MTTVTVHCIWCGNAFSAKVADRKRGWAKACSKSCAAKLREKKLDRLGLQRGNPGTAGSRGAGGRPRWESRDDDAPTFSDAHLFSNEEHDCNKD